MRWEALEAEIRRFWGLEIVLGSSTSWGSSTYMYGVAYVGRVQLPCFSTGISCGGVRLPHPARIGFDFMDSHVSVLTYYFISQYIGGLPS